MEYKALVGTQLTVSRLIFGCEQLGGKDWGKVDENQLEKSVLRALDLGINCFDVADVYGLGQAEERLAKILGPKRYEVTIISKFGVNWKVSTGQERAQTFLDSSPGRVVSALENSLRRLKIDCLPIYLIHWPDPNTPIEDTLETLTKCQVEGKIQYFGVSNFPLPLLQKACNFQSIPFIELQYNLIDRSQELNLIPFCLQNNVNIFAYGALAQGLLTGKYDSSVKFGQDDRRHRLSHFQADTFNKNLRIVDKLSQMSNHYNRTTSQLAIRWILDNPAISAVIVGAKNPYQIETNTGALNWQLTEEDRNYLDNNIGLSFIH